MKELVILSGKGGTGKTTVAGALSHLWAGRGVWVDADVDAANLHLLTAAQTLHTNPFIGGQIPAVDGDLCTGCGACTEHCRFHAIVDGVVDRIACEGCGLCARVCPAQAVTLGDRICGEWFASQTPHGLLLHARLAAGDGNSGKLVSLLREEARKSALQEGAELLLCDGPPGIGCPVMASMAGAHLVLGVAEPSVSGLHDLERVLQLCRHFEIPCRVAINRADVAPEATRGIHALTAAYAVPVIAEIPFDAAVPAAAAAGEPVTATAGSPAAGAIVDLAAELARELFGHDAPALSAG